MNKPISVLVWGHPKTRKSSFGLSFPKPLHVFDFDQGIEEVTKLYEGEVTEEMKAVLKLWPDVQIRTARTGDPFYIHSMGFESFSPGLGEYQALLSKYETRYQAMLKGVVPCATVMVDTDTQWYNVMRPVKLEQALREAQEKQAARRTTPARTEYSKVNEYREITILRAKQHRKNLVLIERSQEIWGTDEEGKNPQGTGQYKPRGQNDTEALVAAVVRMEKRESKDPKSLQQTVKYMGVIESARSDSDRDLAGMVVEGLNYNKLADMLWA